MSNKKTSLKVFQEQLKGNECLITQKTTQGKEKNSKAFKKL